MCRISPFEFFRDNPGHKFIKYMGIFIPTAITIFKIIFSKSINFIKYLNVGPGLVPHGLESHNYISVFRTLISTSSLEAKQI